MEFINKENQLIAVQKVLEEMQRAEECVKSWNSSWWEQLSDAHCLPLHYDVGESDIREMEKKYEPRYKLANAFYSANSIGVPLATETLVGNNTITGEIDQEFEVEFGRIDWYGMNSHKSSRSFTFSNNGTIKFSKSIKAEKIQTKEHPTKISYDTSFNVLSNDFDVSITLDELTADWLRNHKYDWITLTLKGNVLIETFNDIEIMRDLNTGKRLVRIIKKYDKRNNNADVAFEAALNPDNSLEYGAVAIQTHKGNGKINGTYRFDVSRKKGVRAKFYSRKGVKVDLISNPALLGTANTFLPAANSSSDIIISDFANSTQVAIAKDISQKTIIFDNSGFNLEAINQAEEKIIEIVKGIKGELPLPGLIDRINNCLKMLGKKQYEEISDETNCQVLKLEPPTSSQ